MGKGRISGLHGDCRRSFKNQFSKRENKPIYIQSGWKKKRLLTLTGTKPNYSGVGGWKVLLNQLNMTG